MGRLFCIILLVGLSALSGGCQANNKGGGTSINKTTHFYTPDGRLEKMEEIKIDNRQPDNPKDSAKVTVTPNNTITATTGAADQSAQRQAASNRLFQPLVWFGGIMTLSGIIAFVAAPKIHPMVPKLAMGAVLGGISLIVLSALLAQYALYVGIAAAILVSIIVIVLLRKYTLTDKALEETVELVDEEIKTVLPDDKKRAIFEAENAVAKEYQSTDTRKIIKKKRHKE